MVWVPSRARVRILSSEPDFGLHQRGNRGERGADRQIIFKRCMVEYAGLLLNSAWGSNLGRKWKGLKG
jgi:hypothetical protein